LIRDIAPAGGADSASAASAAQTSRNMFAEWTLDILCSPLRSWPGRAHHSHDGDPNKINASAVPDPS
jgi:hypothetical protein